jgi:ribosome assembly protein 4
VKEPSAFLPYKFRVHIPDSDIVVHQYPEDLHALLEKHGVSAESVITFTAEPQSVFRVKAVTRSASRMPGHGQPILAAQFSPMSGSLLATGSGDTTARIWDTDTGTPKHKLAGHTSHVLVVSWSPDGEKLATGSEDTTVRLWDPKTGKSEAVFRGHNKWIAGLAWEPYHLWREEGPRLASASKDGTVRIWIVNSGVTEHVLSGHRDTVKCVKWGGTNQIYTASRDKTVRVWDAIKGTLIHNFTAHAHWVNYLALSTDFALRTGYFDHTPIPDTEEGKRKKARERFEKAARFGGKLSERIVTASDDCTMFLWEPSKGTKPIARLHGHQKQVNFVTFSPDGSLIASTGRDNHTKIWNAR